MPTLLKSLHRHCPVCQTTITPGRFYKPALERYSGAIECPACHASVSRPWREAIGAASLGAAVAGIALATTDIGTKSTIDSLNLFKLFAYTTPIFLGLMAISLYYTYPLEIALKKKRTPIETLFGVSFGRGVHALMIICLIAYFNGVFGALYSTLFFIIGFTSHMAFPVGVANGKKWTYTLILYLAALTFVPWNAIHSFHEDAAKSRLFCSTVKFGALRHEVIMDANQSGLIYSEEKQNLTGTIKGKTGPINCKLYFLDGKVHRIEK